MKRCPVRRGFEYDNLRPPSPTSTSPPPERGADEQHHDCGQANGPNRNFEQGMRVPGDRSVGPPLYHGRQGSVSALEGARSPTS